MGRWILIAIAALAGAWGCHGRPSCKETVEKAVGQLRADSPEAAALIGSCEQQDWSADVRSCVGNAKSQTELSACMARDKKAAAAEKAKAKADQAVQETTVAAQAAQDKVDKLVKDLAEVEGKITAAGSAAGSGSAAKSELAKEKADIETRLAAAKIAAAKAERAKQQAADCAANPATKGC
jgi:hypothetical protein